MSSGISSVVRTSESLLTELKVLGFTGIVIIEGTLGVMLQSLRNHLKCKSCIYLVRDKRTGFIYVGASFAAKGAYVRIYDHLSRTKRGNPSIATIPTEFIEV
jgi:hypothetical protein